MTIKMGRYGKFLACSNYPKCKNTKRMVVNGEGKLEVAADEVTQETCEKCGASMVIKTGRFGKFLACSNYPGCRNTKRITAGGEIVAAKDKTPAVPTGENCPQCGSPLVERKGRFGVFIACSNYPKCRYTQKIAAAPKEEGEEKPKKEKKGAKEEKGSRKKVKG
jgi:DNA topoisomerase I